MYIDDDGETILETLEEIENFAKSTNCSACKHEAMTMVQMMHDTRVLKMVFTTTCSHDL